MPFLATLGGKIGLGLGSVALIIGIYWAWEHSVRSDQTAILEAERAEEDRKQMQAAQNIEREQHKDTLMAVESAKAQVEAVSAALLKKTTAQEAELRKLKGYIEATKQQQPDTEVRYVEVETVVERPVEKPCLVPDNVTARVDELSSLLNAVADRGLPRDGRPPERYQVHSAGPASCAQLIGYLETVASRYANSMIHHREETEFIVKQVAKQRAFIKEYQHE